MWIARTYMTYRGSKIGSIDFGYRFKFFRLGMYKYGSLCYDHTPALIRSARVRNGKTIPTPTRLNTELYLTEFKVFSDVY